MTGEVKVEVTVLLQSPAGLSRGSAPTQYLKIPRVISCDKLQVTWLMARRGAV